MKLVRILSLALCFVSFTAHAVIKKTDSIYEMLKHVDSDTLVVFDVDNVLYQAKQTLGRDQWFMAMIKRYEEQGHGSKAIVKASQLWEKVQQQTEVELVQEGTDVLIQDLVNAGIPVIALTARRTEMMETTLKQVKSLDLALAQKPLYEGEMEIKLDVPMVFKSFYKDGVIFAGPGNNKGHIILKFLENAGLDYSRVIFADDHMRNVLAMERALKGRFDMTSYLYTGAKPLVDALDMRVGDKQLEVFLEGKGYMPDHTAKMLIQDCESKLK